MNGDRPLPERVPVLTEVIEVTQDPPDAVAAERPWPPPAPGAEVPDLSDVPEAAARQADVAVPGPAPQRSLLANDPDDSSLLVDAVLRRIELQLEARLREALAPALARAADTLIREARADLAATLREAVEDALARELGRRREG